MSHSKALSILALFLLNVGCHTAVSPVRRALSINADGEAEAELQSLIELAKIDPGEETKATESLLMLAKTGAPKDEMLKFVRDLKSEIPPWHSNAIASLKKSIDAVHQCATTMEGQEAKSLTIKDQCAAQSDSHTSCRTEESKLLTAVEHLKAQTAEKKEIMDTECKIFRDVTAEAKAAKAAYGGGDEESFLETVCTDFSDLLPRYEDAKKKCTTAQAEYASVKAEYEKKNTEYTLKVKTCDAIQATLDEVCCRYALDTKNTCDSYSRCYEDKVAEYKMVKKEIEQEEKVKKVEWRVWSRIECLLPVLGTDNAAKIEECRETVHSTAHLDIDYPAIPPKDTCTVEAAYPGTDEYYNIHYDSLPENAKVKPVAKCVGMAPPVPSPSGGKGGKGGKGGMAPGGKGGKGGMAPTPTQPLKLGCFVDDGNRAFAGGSVRLGKNSATLSKCAERCSGKAYMAVQDGDECFCGDSYKTHKPYGKVGDAECSKNSACGVQNGCGNAWRSTIYKLTSTASFTVWKTNKECLPNGHSKEKDLGKQTSAEKCQNACIKEAGDRCNYFIFGKGNKHGNCWWEFDSGCSSGQFEDDSYDVYKRT